MAPRFRPWLWLALATLAAALLVAWAVAEGRRERSAVEASLTGQARLLAQALGPALASASAAERELLELLTWKLLDNARLLGELEAAGRLAPEAAGELLEANGLAALWRLGADGSAVWGAGFPVGPAAATAERASLESAAAGAVRGAGDEWVLEGGGPAGGGLVAAGVRTRDDGGLFAAAAPAETFAFARRIGVDSALRELVTTPAVLYLRYWEEPAGLEAEAAWDGGPVPAAPPDGELRGQPCFEVEVPVAAPAGRSASLRVGLDGAPFSAAGVVALRRTTLAAIVLAVLGVLSLAAALAERGRAREREALRRRLAAAEAERQRGERLAAAGALAAGLAHEVRNPLNAIGLAAQRIERLAARDPRRHPPLLELTARIRDEVARLERSLRGFLDLARPAAGGRRALDLAALAGEVLAGLELEAEARRVRWRSRLEPATAVVEPESVRRALVNLVRNALEASPPGSEVEVETGAVPPGANGDGKGWVRVAVRDRGRGLPAELGERAFEAFVTTKPEGTGLGLAIVHQVVAEHRGRSFLQPREGGGAEAVLELPRGGGGVIAGARIVVADDEAAQRDLLADFLADLGAEVWRAADGREALAEVVRAGPDLVLTDVRMPGLSGAELLGEVKRANPEVEVVLVTAYGAVRDAVAALQAGAADYLLKPLDLAEVEHVVRRALERRTLERENRELRRRLGEVESFPGILTAGGAMAEALSTVARAAPTQAPVLILGESGTGKELVARALHAASPRSRRPFVAVHGASLSPTLVESELFGHERGAFTGADRLRRGRFEAADGGTLFLDEVGDLPPAVQVKLLRVLQERRLERVGASEPIAVDARIVAATHQDLPSLVREGRFREDLYYRIAVVTVDLPPLRRRRSDVPLLVEHFRAKHAAGGEPPAFSREAMDLLLAYDYPGNVRELENVVQRALVLARGPQVTSADLPPAVRGARPEGRDGCLDEALPLPERVAALERSAITAALADAAGNQTRAAARLGISERMLRYKLDKHGLKGPATRGAVHGD